ncbi:MAG: MFS transporter [Bryobacterales bacterium]|nr:MFS transporter [Bryobacterales bacterium]MDE0265142.1 MFS transporter [Bryobacterales bacterium]MDE0622055.1 MFS transporter [Bryobacterales bacterium]
MMDCLSAGGCRRAAPSMPLAPSPKSGASRPRTPWALLAVLLAATTTSYIDRIAISVLAPTLRDEFGMSNSEYALVVNCFMVTYMLMYSVGGRLADLLGFRKALTLYIVWWSLTGALHAAAAGFRSLAFYRFLLAVGEGGVWPAGMKTVAHEVLGPLRSLGVGIVNFGSSLGSALTVPLVGWLTVVWGWRVAFLVTGLMGFGLLPFWLAVTRKSAPPATPTSSEGVRQVSWLRVIRYRQAWAGFLARFVSAGAWGFYAFWIPEYLARERGLDIAAIGLVAWLPFVASGLGDLSGSGVTAWLIARGWSVNRARKTVLCVAAAAATAGVGAAYAPNVSLAIASICVGALGFKIASVNFLSLPSDFFPATHVGTAFGFSGTGGSAGIVLTNAAIGLVLDATGSYSIVLLGVALLTPTAVAVTFLVAGRIEPVRELVELEEFTDQIKV